jgi:hypothetical protein
LGILPLLILATTVTSSSTVGAARTFGSTSRVSLAVTTSHEVSDHVSEEGWELVFFSHILLDVGFSVLHGLIDDCKHRYWSLLRLLNLEESVVVASSLFAHGAEIEVLADAALISDSLDRTDSTAVTSNILVDHLLRRVDLLLATLLSKLLAVYHIFEDLLTLLVQLLLDQLLEALAREASKVLFLLGLVLMLALLVLWYIVRIFTV